MNGRNGNGFHHDGPAVENESNFETEHVLPRPKFAELAEEPAYTLLPKEYAGWRIRERFERGGCGGGAGRAAGDVVRGGERTMRSGIWMCRHLCGGCSSKAKCDLVAGQFD